MNREQHHPAPASGSVSLRAFAASMLLVLLLPLAAAAQFTGTVAGAVHDAAGGAPLKGAIATLRDPADSNAKPLGDVADQNGAFSIGHVPIGHRYVLEVRFAGYERYVAENIVIAAEKPTLDVGTISLVTLPVEKGTIEVTAPREQVMVFADKMVYGVENNPVYTATTVSELLGQISSVQVDQDGKISLRGSENVTIMMNDRPLTMPRDQLEKYLQTLPANMVKSVEIRTNPGAQFDAKNQGGIINIVTRRTMSDVIGGNVNAGVDSRGRLSGGAGLYFNGDELNASIGGGGYHGPEQGTSSSLRLNYTDTSQQRITGSGTSSSESNAWYAYGQADYNLTRSDLASFSFNANRWSSGYTSYGDHTIYDTGDLITGRFYDTNAPNPDAANSGGYSTASLLLKHTFSEDHKLSLDVSYNAFSYNNGSRYVSTYFLPDGGMDSSRSTNRLNRSSYANATVIARLDYENPISDMLKLTFGAKDEINSLDDNTAANNWNQALGEFVPDTVQTNHYLPKNTIYALYGQAAWMVTQGLNLQAGLRAEHANVSAHFVSGSEIISRTYTNLFPSGSLAWTVGGAHTITLSYRRSIALPDVDALNPIKVKWNDLYTSSGNPDLNPEFTNTFELNYNTYWGMGNMVTIGPYYAATLGNIEQSDRLINGATYSTSENFNGSYSIGSELSFSFRPSDWFNVRASGSIYNKVNRGSAIPGDIRSSAVGYNGNASFSADLMTGLTFSMSMFFNSPPTVGGNHQGRFVFWNFSLRQKLLENRLSISLRLNDPFNLQSWHSTYSSPEFYTESTSKHITRFVGLNLSYNFGTVPRLEQHDQQKSETKGGGGSGGGNGGGGGQ
ncbi:MAG: TonB-dependent receptor [Bacteroidetes bacterium]|nr:TonB-dependent receptor [Bacteroidota bacterium]